MKRSKVPKFLKGIVVHKPRVFMLKDIVDNEITHSLQLHSDFIGIRPISNNHLVIIGLPDTSIDPDKDYETDVHIGNHATILIKGFHKGDLEIRILADEYPTKLIIDKSRGEFEDITILEDSE